jgi:DNA-binding transcriptional LysR family regulator
MDLNEIAIFIRVVQTGSFTQAAQQLQMPKSTVSSKISALEKRLGVTLIQRTTRKLNVTSAGQAYFKRCVRGLEEIKGGEQELASIQGEPQGLLRVTAPADLGASVLPELVGAFIRKYPKVSIELLLTDRMVDLLAESVDLAVRGGVLEDSSLIARKLGSDYFAPFASPQYLKERGTPTHPRDFRQHECIQFTPMGTETWEMTNAKGTLQIPVPARIISSDLSMVKKLVVMGNGIALLPTFLCYEEVKAKKLVRILPEWKSGSAPLHFVYPAQRFVTPKLSAFIAMATDPLRKSLKEFEI